ncbi:Uncharacterised protein [Vibrio cholerae]|nr:Uncharacterised protein [Vibrio cholerae]CSC75852.1 Uncharacterised protein [Vibrio cholerae]CSI68670.1 Uncharacterised protein [Vibrio cholerae]
MIIIADVGYYVRATQHTRREFTLTHFGQYVCTASEYRSNITFADLRHHVETARGQP